MPEARRAYPSELSNAEWAILAPLLSHRRSAVARGSGPTA